MNKNLIAEIFVPLRGSGGTEGEIATGYPVGKNLILTARHPLFPEAPGRDADHPIEVRWRHPAVDPQRWWPIGDIVWESQDWDLALLECDLPSVISPWSGFLSEQRPQATMEWESVGFPSIGGEKNGVRRPFAMKGSVRHTDPDLELETTAGPPEEEDWKGACGSPVFVNWRIRGVVVSGPDEAGRLKAMPIWRVLHEDAHFRKTIGYEERRARRKRMQQRVSEVLASSPAAVDALAAQVPGAEDAIALDGKDESKAARTAEQLLDLEVDQVVKACKAAHGALSSSSAAAAAIVETVQMILPAVYDHGVVEAVRNARGDVAASLITLPAYFPTVAEIIMAGVDRRETLFCPREREDQFPKGLLNVPEPPEGGFDSDGQRALAALNRHLTSKFSPIAASAFLQAVDEFMIQRFYTPRLGGPERTPEQKIEAAAEELRYWSEEEGRTHYLIVPAANDPEGLRILEGTFRQIRSHYPSLVCLSLASDYALERAERRSFRPLLPLLPKIRTRSAHEVGISTANDPMSRSAGRRQAREITIYLSSTFKDLETHRKAVFDALRQADYRVIAMEDYVAQDERPLKRCLDDVDGCDIYVGVFAFRYGYRPPAEHGNRDGLSITELEFHRADANSGVHCLAFLVDENAPWPPSQMDAQTGKDDDAKRIKALREYLAREKMASFFTTPHDLASKVQSAITKLLAAPR